MGDTKPNVLILGGCGFIGRNLVKFLVEGKLCENVRVADKNLPATSYLSPEHKAAFDEKYVQFVQADLTRDDHVAKVFREMKFDFVVNCCGETRFGLSEEEYKKKCVEPAQKCGAAAVEQKVKKWVEISTAQVYKGEKKASKEDGKIEPWTTLAKYRLEAEEKVKAIEGLPVVILRASYVYGPGDLSSIMPRAVCAAVYQDRKEKMKFLWSNNMKLNTVHINDVVRAIWHSCTTLPAGGLFNLSDPQDADQGMVNNLLGQLFGVEVGFYGSMLSNVASVQLTAVAEEANDKHVPGWTKLCQKNNILNTPLSPYIDKELLKNNHLCVDGTAITATGFTYETPLTKESLKEMIQAAVNQGIFPSNTLKEDA